MADNYNLTFVWPHTEPKDVVVTGTFDGWNSTNHLKRTGAGFETTIAVPWGSKVLYKFRVDGDWITHEDQPTEVDPIGNVNNVTYTPEKPSTPVPAAETNGVIVVEKENAVLAAPPAPVVEEKPTPVIAPTEPEPPKEVTAPPPQVEEKKAETPTPRTAPDVPVQIQPVLDAITNTTVESKVATPTPQASTHTPVPVSEVAPEPTPAPDPPSAAETARVPEDIPAPVAEFKPSESETPISPPPRPSTPPPAATSPTPSAPTTPAKTNGSHTRESTDTTTPPTSMSAPSTPKNKHTFPSDGLEDSPASGSIHSRSGSQRKKRVSIIDKIKAVFHHGDASPEREEKKAKKKRHSLAQAHSHEQ